MFLSAVEAGEAELGNDISENIAPKIAEPTIEAQPIKVNIAPQEITQAENSPFEGDDIEIPVAPIVAKAVMEENLIEIEPETETEIQRETSVRYSNILEEIQAELSGNREIEDPNKTCTPTASRR